MSNSARHMFVVPVTLRAANDYVAAHHRHNKPVVGAKFALAVRHAGELAGVAIGGRPVARHLDDGLTLEVTRVCVRDGAPKNCCSFLYGACWRVWREMGGGRILTYTLERETGASLRATGWRQWRKLPGRLGWNCVARPREFQAIYLEDKISWVAQTPAYLAQKYWGPE